MRSHQYDSWYNDRWWRREAKAFLANVWMLAPHFGLCAHCKRAAATVVDHIKPHKGDRVLFEDPANWQGLCRKCHSEKTAREDGGFGNACAEPQWNEFGTTGIRGTTTALSPADQARLRKMQEKQK